MAAPLKKDPPKKRIAKSAKPLSPQQAGRLPSTGKCKHSGFCYRAELLGLPDGVNNQFHYPDEAGAVMFAMRQSRDQAIGAAVYGPDGGLITRFAPRTYDVVEARHELLSYNEGAIEHREVWEQVHQARKERHKSLLLSKTPAKKAKVLRKR